MNPTTLKRFISLLAGAVLLPAAVSFANPSESSRARVESKPTRVESHSDAARVVGSARAFEKEGVKPILDYGRIENPQTFGRELHALAPGESMTFTLRGDYRLEAQPAGALLVREELGTSAHKFTVTLSDRVREGSSVKVIGRGPNGFSFDLVAVGAQAHVE